MVVTRAAHHQAYLHEVERLSLISVEHLETPVSTVTFVIHLPTFGGSSDEDVTKWLHDVDTIFDRATIQPPIATSLSNPFSSVPPPSGFNTELLKAYEPALNAALFKLGQQFQTTDESVMKYYYDKMQLCSQADPTMSPTMTMHHLMKGLKHTLTPHLARRLPISGAR